MHEMSRGTLATYYSGKMLIPGGKCRHFIPEKKFQGKNVDIFSPRIANRIPRNGEMLVLEKRARHHLKIKKKIRNMPLLRKVGYMIVVVSAESAINSFFL